METNRFFSLLAIAILGSLALAFNPDEQTNIVRVPPPVEFDTLMNSQSRLQLENPELTQDQLGDLKDDFELDDLEEVELINSGGFKPYEIGSSAFNQ